MFAQTWHAAIDGRGLFFDQAAEDQGLVVADPYCGRDGAGGGGDVDASAGTGTGGEGLDLGAILDLYLDFVWASDDRPCIKFASNGRFTYLHGSQCIRRAEDRQQRCHGASPTPSTRKDTSLPNR